MRLAAVTLLAICAICAVLTTAAFIKFEDDQRHRFDSTNASLELMKTQIVQRQPKWEYMMVTPPDEVFEEAINSYGLQGWELIFARRARNSSTASMEYEMVFKRPVPEKEVPGRASALKAKLETIEKTARERVRAHQAALVPTATEPETPPEPMVFADIVKGIAVRRATGNGCSGRQFRANILITESEAKRRGYTIYDECRQ